MNNFNYLETESTNPKYNLAFEEYVLNEKNNGDYLILWQNEPSVIIGQNQNAEGEINRAFIEENNIHVVRRSTGGGAVYHDLGNINYSFITDNDGDVNALAKRFTEPIVSFLKKLGLDASISGRNDIVIGEKKISGTAQRIIKNRILHHGTLLFNSDLTFVSKALNVSQDKFQSKSTKSVRSRVGNISDFLDEKISLKDFWNELKISIFNEIPKVEAFSKEDFEKIETIKANKYDLWEWNFGRSPKFNFSNKVRLPGGSLEVLINVQSGTISSLCFYGDFLSKYPLDEIINALKGVPFKGEEISKILSRFPLEYYFGTITKEEIIDTIFH